jgi:hypothetical protein
LEIACVFVQILDGHPLKLGLFVRKCDDMGVRAAQHSSGTELNGETDSNRSNDSMLFPVIEAIQDPERIGVRSVTRPRSSVHSL